VTPVSVAAVAVAGWGADVALPVIRLRGVGKVYGEGEGAVRALDEVDLDIEPGEYVAIMGSSGSGKSTLMHILGLLDAPTVGTYRLDGVDVSHLDEDEAADVRNRKIGFVFQQFNLLPRQTALENVALPLLYLGGVSATERRAHAQEVLELVGLGDRLYHRPQELSGGEQQRVAIARALITRPALLLADEPTGNLDSRTSAELMALFEELNGQGITIVLVTHERDIAAHAARVLAVHDGLLDSDSATQRPPTTSHPDGDARRAPVAPQRRSL